MTLMAGTPSSMLPASIASRFSSFPDSIRSAVIACFHKLPICSSIFRKVFLSGDGMSRTDRISFILTCPPPVAINPHTAATFMLCRICPPGPFDLGCASTASDIPHPLHLNWITQAKPFRSISCSKRGVPLQGQTEAWSITPWSDLPKWPILTIRLPLNLALELISSSLNWTCQFH